MVKQGFGGKWTEHKLTAVEKYLRAYLKITHKYNFKTTYLDGFAGSGRNYVDKSSEPELAGLFDDFDSEETEEFYRGSAYRALAVDPPFDNYLFIETKAVYIEELRRMVEQDFPARADTVNLLKGNANVVIPQWCAELRSDDRALVFLDPYGMEVNWTTVEALAATKKVDLWVLVPLGQAIIRLLTNHRPPPPEWGGALTRFFGTEGWRDHFYVTQQSDGLFGAEESDVRDVDFDRIVKYVVSRLGSIFAQVLDEPILLRNSTGIPIYLLCFAAANPNGAPTAVKIARDIAKALRDGK